MKSFLAFILDTKRIISAIEDIHPHVFDLQHEAEVSVTL